MIVDNRYGCPASQNVNSESTLIGSARTGADPPPESCIAKVLLYAPTTVWHAFLTTAQRSQSRALALRLLNLDAMRGIIALKFGHFTARLH